VGNLNPPGNQFMARLGSLVVELPVY